MLISLCLSVLSVCLSLSLSLSLSVSVSVCLSVCLSVSLFLYLCLSVVLLLLIHMDYIWIKTLYNQSCLSSWPAIFNGKNFNVGQNMLTFQPYFFHTWHAFTRHWLLPFYTQGCQLVGFRGYLLRCCMQAKNAMVTYRKINLIFFSHPETHPTPPPPFSPSSSLSLSLSLSKQKSAVQSKSLALS